MLFLLTTFVLICTPILGIGIPNGFLNYIDNKGLKFLNNIFKEKYAQVQSDNSGAGVGKPLILTKYIEQNKLEEAKKAAYVKPLIHDKESYAGYLTVNKQYNANLWFWYFPVKNQPVEETPWIIWLQGGPGGSSMFGLFDEIGPFKINDENQLEEMKYSWGKNHSLLFFDNPVGTGYSFVDDKRGYATNQTTIGENLYTALQQFLTIFPELRKAPLTIADESYAGKHIPSIGIQIHRNKNDSMPINLQSLAIGNGFMDPVSLVAKYSYFLREVGLLDDNVADELLLKEQEVVDFINNGQMIEAYNEHDEILSFIKKETHIENIYNYLTKEVDKNKTFIKYITTDKMRLTLHVGNTTFGSALVLEYLESDFEKSVKHWIEELIINYKVMCYNGHLDIIVAYHPSVNTYYSFDFPQKDEFKVAKRHAWKHDNELAGYYRSAGNFIEVMVRRAGHMVPHDRPSAALGLISAFVRGISLEKDTGILVHN